MKKSKLKQMLDEGTITQEEYNSLIENAEDDDDNGNKNDEPEEPTEQVRKLAKQIADKATATLGKENADLKKKLKALETQNLTAEQIKKIEDEEKEALLAEREKNVRLAENKLFAIEAMKDVGLDDGSKISFELLDLVMNEDKDVIKANIKALNTIINKKVKEKVDAVFKDNSRTPGKANGGSGVINPYAAETFNLTEQMRLEVEDPERAKQLKALAAASNK